MGGVEILSPPLARKLAQASFAARRMVGVLINRKGEIAYVMVGDATRLYLPDIGRVRGGQDRLRGLRLVVARPTPLNVGEHEGKTGPIITPDFKTDLEKLRLDAVIELDASRDGVDGPLILAHLASANQALVVKSHFYKNIHDLKESLAHFLDELLKDIAKTVAEPALKPSGMLERAILVGIYDGPKKVGLASMAELTELARSARVEVVDKVYQWRSRVYPKTFIGPGKLEEICLNALSLGVEMLIFDHDLTPSQLNNITDLTDLKILDRTMLILDIFANRAVTREGKLQVEMAQLSYSLPRLAKKQSGLSRLTGGIGGKGPGETKLEVDRRRVKDKLAKLADELELIKKQRELRRKSRISHQVPAFAIVGYTNAGKSSLLNALCKADIYAKDELFATLDPHSRRLRFPEDREVLFTDTVGFINNLPESLMKAFMATLEELTDADVLVHVIDIADDNYLQQIRVVNQVLAKLELENKPRVLVFNKIDKIDEETLNQRIGQMKGVRISATQKLGFKELIETLVLALNEPELSEQNATSLGAVPTNPDVDLDEWLKN